MVVPEINPQHMEVIKYQKERLGTKRGFVAVKPNCSIQSYAPVLQHGKSLSHMRLLLQHIRQSQAPERHSRTGLRWLETSFHSSVERKKNLRKSHFVSGDMWMMRKTDCSCRVTGYHMPVYPCSCIKRTYSSCICQVQKEPYKGAAHRGTREVQRSTTGAWTSKRTKAVHQIL